MYTDIFVLKIYIHCTQDNGTTDSNFKYVVFHSTNTSLHENLKS